MRTISRKAIVSALLLAAISFCVPRHARAQAGESDLRVFGYLQASLYQEYYPDAGITNANSFTVQQLDIMMQKDLGRHWSSFVDLLMTNNFSSRGNTGTFDLEQAWVRYRRNSHLNIKAGMLIPQFNYLNEIRNKMPVLPYIIRPIVYETSFQEDVNIYEYIPQRAFFQVYGYAPVGDYKFDYAVYAGNSPNVNRDPAFGQTGLDTTSAFLTGGRVGLRHTHFQFGFSATHDKVDYLDTILPDTLSPALVFKDIDRVRMGTDLMIDYRRFKLEAEYIRVQYDDDHPEIDNDKTFFYGTLGYRFTDRLFGYGSYWHIAQHYNLREASGWSVPSSKLFIPTGGVSYQMSDRVILKGAAARVKQEIDAPGYGKRVFHFYTVAVSVLF